MTTKNVYSGIFFAKAKQLRMQLLTILLFCVVLSFFSLAFADDFRYDSKGKRDPFVPQAQFGLKEKQIGVAQLKIEGIILDQAGKSFAIVNGEIVKEGDAYGGFKVKKIVTNQVTFEDKNGKPLEIILDQNEIMAKKYLEFIERKPKAAAAGQQPAIVKPVERPKSDGLENLAEMTKKKLMEETSKSETKPDENVPVEEGTGSSI
jgi:hypothetical protein